MIGYDEGESQTSISASVNICLRITTLSNFEVVSCIVEGSSSSQSASLLHSDQTKRGRFVETNGADGHFRFIESTPGGCAFIDYDNDGFPDILLIQSGPSDAMPTGQARPHCALYHNNGNGTFTDVTAGSGLDKDLGFAHGVAVGDYDNDGYDDLFVTSYPRNFLFHNEHGKTFRDVTQKMGLGKQHSTGYATSAAFGDYDNDGRLDLYVCYYTPWSIASDRACKDGRGTRDYCTPEIYRPETHQLWRNEVSRFTDVTHAAGIDRTTGRGLAVAFLPDRRL